MSDSTTPLPRGARAGPIAWLVAVVTAMASIAAALVGAMVVIGALLLGAVVAFGVLVWALLRGRRIARSGAFGHFGRFRQGPVGMKPGPVVDVEVREVHDAPEARGPRSGT